MAETNYALASLAARPQATENFVSIADMMRNRALAQQQIAASQTGQQLTQQQIQTEQLKNQQMQAQLAANQKFGQLWASSGGDLTKLHGSLQEAAASDPNLAQFAPQYIQELNQYQQQHYALGDAEAKNLDTKNGIVLPLFDALRKSGPEDRGAIRDKLVQTMQNTPNLFEPEEIQAAQQMPLDDQTIKQNYAAHQSQTQLLAERKQAADDLKAHAEEMKDRFENLNGTLVDKSTDPPKPVIFPQMKATGLRDAIDKIAPADNPLTAQLNKMAQVQVQAFLDQGNQKAANDALTELTRAVASINEKTNPTVLQAEATKTALAETERNKALAPNLSNLIQTTTAGRKYLNAEDVKGASESLLRKQASDQGIMVVDKDAASNLTDIDTVLANQRSLLEALKGKLATSPTARIFTGPENKFEAAAQTDPALAAFGAWRSSAIKTMRALAGSKGLRINQAEIQQALDNDIPKITDTWSVANQKVQNIQKQLDNSESAILTRNRQGGAGGNMIFARDPQGQLHQAPVGTALPKGWKLEGRK